MSVPEKCNGDCASLVVYRVKASPCGEYCVSNTEAVLVPSSSVGDGSDGTRLVLPARHLLVTYCACQDTLGEPAV